ncbi:MAG: hypothetical protein D6820_11630 [Lentisphaerae bacterium]|nr:MAG: hypothetical protein D6820_11630 [Lentisphaerota bacterium]
MRLGERGESMFVAFQLRLAFREFIELAKLAGRSDKAAWAEVELKRYDELLEKYAWDGQWYLRAYREDGFKFGSATSEEGRIFMNAQTWAVISGHAQGERARQILEIMHRELATEYGIMLCAPPYTRTDHKIALARLMNPGNKENAGIFNHVQGWAVMAAAMAAMPDRAWEYLYQVMPARFNDIAEIREVEPYVVCQSTHSRFSRRFGKGRVSWLSGSAVWNYYAMTHVILGVQPDYTGLRLQPIIPAGWSACKLQRHFRGCHFDIEIRRGDCDQLQIECNGERMPGNLIPAERFQPSNRVVVTLPSVQH